MWWSEGQTTLCWPQELYRIGDYDSEAGELWDDETEFDDVEDFDQCNVLDDSQQSWETESETSVAGDVSYRYSFLIHLMHWIVNKKYMVDDCTFFS